MNKMQRRLLFGIAKEKYYYFSLGNPGRLLNSSLERWIECRHLQMELKIRNRVRKLREAGSQPLYSRPGNIFVRPGSSCSPEGWWGRLKQDNYLFVIAPKTLQCLASLSPGQRISVSPKTKCDKHAQLRTSRIKGKLQQASKSPGGPLKTQLPAPARSFWFSRSGTGPASLRV